MLHVFKSLFPINLLIYQSTYETSKPYTNFSLFILVVYCFCTKGKIQIFLLAFQHPIYLLKLVLIEVPFLFTALVENLALQHSL